MPSLAEYPMAGRQGYPERLLSFFLSTKLLSEICHHVKHICHLKN